MGYFSNGTEGKIFQEAYCLRCVNWRDLDDGRGPGCPVYDTHLLFAYELCNSEEAGKTILDMLIEPIEGVAADGIRYFGNRCTMFQAAVGEDTEPERRKKSQDEWEREYDDAVQWRDHLTCFQLLVEREGLSWWPVGEDTE